jgi:murein DD-endopeptidase MepM/ murein hydrolase activator NlpD
MHLPTMVAVWWLAAPASAGDRQPWLLFPVDPQGYRGLTSDFGPRDFGGRRERHEGVDLAAPSGTLVVAAAPGVVARMGWGERSGWYVVIRHELGWETVYCHLLNDPANEGLTEGLSLRVGSPVGHVGATGKRVTGPHLHFSVRTPDHRLVNPGDFLYSPAESIRLVQQMGGLP